MPVRPPVFQPFGRRPTKAPQPRSDRFYHTAEWQLIVVRVLTRDNYLCRLRYDDCTIRATTVDHIIERKQEGSDDPSNLRSVCSACHNRRHHNRRHSWRTSRD